MKAKKAIKRLQRVEVLLSTVIDEFAAVTPEVRDLLNMARAGLESASKAVAASPVPQPAPKTAKDQAGKRLSVARKKRSVTARREGVSTQAKPSRKSPANSAAASS